MHYVGSWFNIFPISISDLILFSEFTAGIFPASLLVAASYAGCDRPLVVVLFILAMGFLGNYFPGLRVNALDLSPNYAASIISIVNGAGSLTGVVVPTFVGFMTPDVRLERSFLHIFIDSNKVTLFIRDFSFSVIA